MSVTGRTIVTEAFEELNVFDAGTAMPALDADFGLRRLNRILSLWNTKGVALPAVVTATYAQTASLQPHTIGPSGATWTATRPMEILKASQIGGSGTGLYRYKQIPLLTEQEFHAITSYALEDGTPQAAWYNPTSTSGSLYFWPVPNAAHIIELVTREPLTAMTLTTTFTLPDGYQDALTLTLAEALCTPYSKQVPPQLAKEARAARVAIFDLNRKNHGTPRLTMDAGVPGDRSGGYNYLIGPYE